jgi:hypothetical protein
VSARTCARFGVAQVVTKGDIVRVAGDHLARQVSCSPRDHGGGVTTSALCRIGCTVLLLILSGCTSNAVTEADRHRVEPGVTARPGPGKSRPEIARTHTSLRVEWAEAGQRWPTVLRIPYGPEDDQLGIDRFPTMPPIVPSALAITPLGFAIADPAKNRVVLVSREGKLVRTWAGIPQVASDMAYDAVHDRLVLISNESERRVMALYPDGTRVRGRLAWHPVSLTSTPAGVTAWTVAPTGSASRFTPLGEDLDATGSAAILTPAGDIESRSLSRDGDRYRVSAPGDWSHTFSFTARTRPHQVAAGFEADVSMTNHTVLFAMLVGSFHSYPGNRPLYLLELDPSDGHIETFQQIRTGSLSDTTNQYTYITGAPSGEVYQLCLNSDGVQIRKRP